MQGNEVTRKIRIRKPTLAQSFANSSSTYLLNRPVKGARVGLAKNAQWQSWILMTQVWSDLLKRDGAEPVVVQTSHHTGETGAQMSDAFAEWADSIDCAAVGLGN